MDNFYQQFWRRYFSLLLSDRVTYKSVIRKNVPVILKVIYYYEKTIRWMTGGFSGNRYSCALIQKDNFYIDNIEQFENTYHLLCDNDSKARYVEYIAFKAINSIGIRLDAGNRNIEHDLIQVDRCKITHALIDHFSNIGELNVYDLSPLGYNVKLINDSIGTLIDFVYEQYAYKELFRPEQGDVVIDCGGAIGDTAVYFSDRGASDVYVFEFIRSNIEVIKEQISMNPDLNGKITIVDKPVWEASGVELSYLDNGNSSCVAEAGVFPNSVRTLSIDDMVSQNALEKIDLIKMDIEGAEMPALKGAEATIRKFKPKLAICVYHKKEDLIEIPNYIQSLNPDYKFYFDYYTDIGWEAVLYAIDRSNA